MLAWAPPEERFVNVPGVVEIRWKSDDPMFARPTVDLFEKQKENQGLSDNYGKKDKTTKVQKFFHCIPCECDLMSVITLRSHCGGSQHILKARKLEMEYKKKIKLGQVPSLNEEAELGPSDLYQALLMENKAIVGLRFITEYSHLDKSRRPYYHCSLPDCGNFCGSVQETARHVLQLRHRTAWTKEERGLTHIYTGGDEVNRYATINGENLHDNYRLVQRVDDNEKYYLCKDKKIRAAALLKVEKRDRESEESSTKRFKRSPRSSSPNNHQPTSEFPEESKHFPRHQTERFRDFSPRRESAEQRNSRRGGLSPRGESSSRTRDSSPYGESSYRTRDSSPYGESSSRIRDSSPYGESRQPVSSNGNTWNGRIKQEVQSNPDVEILRQRGTFNFRDVSNIKPEGGAAPRQEIRPVETVVTHPATEPPRLSEQETIRAFHDKVTKYVKACLNRHYPGANEYVEGTSVIDDRDTYVSLARHFSRKLREQLKESYLEYNRSLDGLTVTPDFKEIIRVEVEAHFERSNR